MTAHVNRLHSMEKTWPCRVAFDGLHRISAGKRCRSIEIDRKDHSWGLPHRFRQGRLFQNIRPAFQHHPTDALANCSLFLIII